MGLLSLAGSIFGPVGGAVGGLVESLLGGNKKAPASQPSVRELVSLPESPWAGQYASDFGQEEESEVDLTDVEEVSRMLAQLRQQENPVLAQLFDGRGGSGDVHRRTGDEYLPGRTNTGTPPATRTPTQIANAAGGSAQPSLNLDDILTQYVGKMLTQSQPSDASWKLAQGNLAQTLNAQAQQSRQALLSNLAQRGLHQSGLMSRGVQGIETAKGEALAKGLSQLEQQRVQQQAQERQWAMQTALDATLRRQQMELQARQLGIQESQINEARSSAMYEMLGGLAGALGQSGLLGGGTSDTTTDDGDYWKDYASGLGDFIRK